MDKETFSFLSKTRSWFLASFTVVFLTASPIQATQAQALDQAQLSALMSVIDILLLSGREEPIDEPLGSRIDIDLNQLLPDSHTVTDALYAAFDLQDAGAELCFDISSNNGALNPGDIIVEVNGKAAAVTEGNDNCYVLLEQNQREINYVLIKVVGAGVSIDVSRVELAPSSQYYLALPTLTRGGWNERAVRKVLKIFAFGGHATNAQIIEWADMYPQDAILEMLNFDEHNLKLSPLAVGETYTDTATAHGSFLGFQNFISSPTSNIPIPVDNRTQYGIDGYNFDDAYGRMITVRGLNPFRQRIGFWETNYHLAVNRDASVDRDQIAAYYDLIMEAHEAGLPYHEVMGIAAKSAAIAEQYGHDRNRWIYDRNLDEYVCNCNDDFAREIHQLFYGIFGANDPNHEDGTIRETAKMLTDMPIDNTDGPLDNIQVVFGTAQHHTDNLTILGQTVIGANASEKIDSLMPISIQHPESLANLPVMIVSVLADDNLSEHTKIRLRASWASMGANKNFLEFIQTYAISELFHSRSQFKYFTTHERALYLANKNNLDNLEAYFGGGSYSGRAGRSVGGLITRDGAGDFFRPLHNVFGGQSSLEASDSALAFENNYNTLTDDSYLMRDIVQCDSCDLGQPWEKKWETVLPQRADGEFYVEDIAPWLWNHAVGNFDNYNELEKAHLYSLLGAAGINPDQNNDGEHPLDFNLLMCMVEDYQTQTGNVDVAMMLSRSIWDRYCRHGDEGLDAYNPVERAAINRVYTSETIAANATAQDVLAQLGAMTLPLNATTGHNGGATPREHARERINNALGFIFTTPFVFAEGQK